jgi:hypothetical protein
VYQTFSLRALRTLPTEPTEPMEYRVPRVTVTDEAKEVIDELRERHGDLMFHQSGGCCDGSSPMCFQQGDFRLGRSDVKLGEIYDCPFYMAKDQFEYWQHMQLTLDVKEGRGASFSLEIPTGKRFVIKSRLFTEEELQVLEDVEAVDA